MNTPTPRTDAEITFTGAYTHTCGELSCDECNARTAALRAERDHWQEIAKTMSAEREHNANVAQEMTAERDQLRVARAEKAEAELAAAKERLRSEAMDDYASIKHLQRELATERARLNSGQILLIVAGERVWHCGVDLRAAIDAGMKEGAK